MLEVLFSFLSSLRVYFQSSADLQLELIALRHQITVLQRKTPKPRLKPADRRLWAWLSRFWSRWQSALVIVKPNTVIDWHRRGFRWYWTWKIRHGRTGRPRFKLFGFRQHDSLLSRGKVPLLSAALNSVFRDCVGEFTCTVCRHTTTGGAEVVISQNRLLGNWHGLLT